MISPRDSATATAMAWPLPPPSRPLGTTRAPASAATVAVASVDPSSTTRISSTRPAPPPAAVQAAATEATMAPTVACLVAGREAHRDRAPAPATGQRGGVEFAVVKRPPGGAHGPDLPPSGAGPDHRPPAALTKVPNVVHHGGIIQSG